MAATRFRRDVTEEDLYLTARFKAYLMRAVDRETIVLVDVPQTYQQHWALKKVEWVAVDRILDPHPAVGVRLPDFRYIIRGIQREVNVTEGRIVSALEKISLFRYTGLKGGWKTKGTPPLVLLEDKRFLEGTIRRKRPGAPAARLAKAQKEFAQDVADAIAQGIAPNIARQIAMVSHGDLAELEAAVLAEQEKKPERYAKTREKIESSKFRA